MAAFISGQRYKAFGGQREQETAIALEKMERGPAKARRIRSDVEVEVTHTLMFSNKQRFADFMVWFDTTIKSGADYFDWVDPFENVQRLARIKDGQLGPLLPMTNGHDWSSMQLTFVYSKSVYA